MGFDMLTGKSPKNFMIPYVEFPCPNCEHRLRVKYEYLGGKLRCKYCAHEFVSPSAEEGIPWAPSGQPETGDDAQAAQRRIAVLETELASLRQELSSRTAEHSAASEKIQQAMHQSWADQRSTVDLRDKLLATQTELQSVRQELSLRTAEFTAATDNFQRAQTELRRWEEQVHQAWADQRNVAEANQKLLSELETLRAQAVPGQGSAAEAGPVPTERGAEAAARAPTLGSSGGSAARRLKEKAQNIRAQLEASSSIKEQIDRLSAELATAQADRDRLSGQVQAAEADAAQLRGKVAELEQSLSDLTKTHAVHSRETEQRLEEENARIESDRQLLQEQLDAIRQKHEQETASLRAQVEQLNQEIAAVREERDAAISHRQALSDERDRVTAERDDIDARYKEAIEGLRADMARLTQTWQQSRQQEIAAVEQNRTLTQQLEKLRSELEQHHGRENEYKQKLAALQQAADAARAEAAEQQRKWQEQLDAAQRRLDDSGPLQSEVERLREEVKGLQEALEIVGVVAE